MKIDIYSDGSATTGKPGGYGFVIVVDEVAKIEGRGYSPVATNNDMELEGAIQGLEAFDKLGPDWIREQLFSSKDPTTIYVNLCSDSQIILGWADGSYKFKQLDKIDKYHRLKKLVEKHVVKTVWVKGHNGNEFNERCDKLAGLARKQIAEELEPKPDPNLTLIGSKKNGILCIWHGSCLKVIDLENNIVEDYVRSLHGKRGSLLEIRKEDSR